MSLIYLLITAGSASIVAAAIVFKVKYSGVYLIGTGVIALIIVPILTAITKQTIYIEQITFIAFASLCSGLIIFISEHIKQKN